MASKNPVSPERCTFCGLFGGFAFGEKDQAVTFGEVGESFRDAIENFRWSAFEFNDAGVNFGESFTFGHLVGQFQVGFFERATEADERRSHIGGYSCVPVSFRMWRM